MQWRVRVHLISESQSHSHFFYTSVSRFVYLPRNPAHLTATAVLELVSVRHVFLHRQVIDIYVHDQYGNHGHVCVYKYSSSSFTKDVDDEHCINIWAPSITGVLRNDYSN